mgnify:CR=1 FL=1
MSSFAGEVDVTGTESTLTPVSYHRASRTTPVRAGVAGMSVQPTSEKRTVLQLSGSAAAALWLMAPASSMPKKYRVRMLAPFRFHSAA